MTNELTTVLLVLTGALGRCSGRPQNALSAAAPMSLLATAMMAVWQWQLSGPRGGRGFDD